MSKWDIDWKKVGKKNKVKRITEPSNGIGTGIGTVALDKSYTSLFSNVKAANIVMPLKPSVDNRQSLKSEVSFLQPSVKISASVSEVDVVNMNDVMKSEGTIMDTSTATKTKDAGQDRVADGKKDASETVGSFKRNGDYKRGANRKRGRDMTGGMELLEVDFLIGVVEDVDGADTNDVMMRKLCFNELVRADHRSEIDSVTLSIYAIDADKLYGKEIQCQAMLELTERTGNSA